MDMTPNNKSRPPDKLLATLEIFLRYWRYRSL